MGSAALESVKDRIRAVFGSWSEGTPVEQMRHEWEDLFAASRVSANSERIRAGGVDAEWVTAPSARSDRVLLYFHGGGYALGSVKSHWELIARLSAASGCRALGLEYRLSPENPFPAPVEDACAAYRWLLGQGIEPRHIALAGDSAGGGLTAAALVSLRDGGTPLPAAAAMLSPWVDLEATGESYDTRAEVDPMVQRPLVLGMAQTYLGGKASPRDPLAAPLYADLAGLPPLLIHVGDHETLLDDSTRFAEKARAAGVAVTLHVWEEMVHVFQLFAADLPEARQAIDAIGTFLRKHVG